VSRTKPRKASTTAAANPGASPSVRKRPTCVSEYRTWARKALKIEHDDGLRRWYELNAAAARNAIQLNPFFRELSSELDSAQNDYRKSTKVDLLMERQAFLVLKPYESIIDKSLRRNVLENPNFPEPPKGGWFVPDTWFALNNDIVRTTIVCKYMDGPRYLADRLVAHADRLGLKARNKSQQNDDGYYAYHFYVRMPVEITSQEWTAAPASIEVEIQITTQLQEVLRALTHKLYETRRLDVNKDAHAWKWERKAARFRAAYLGHSLHMLEAVILDLRESGGSS
jgi:ppGpp synthetase/RelA/SpoT-type nucleotidyltranferase